MVYKAIWVIHPMDSRSKMKLRTITLPVKCHILCRKFLANKQANNDHDRFHHLWYSTWTKTNCNTSHQFTGLTFIKCLQDVIQDIIRMFQAN